MIGLTRYELARFFLRSWVSACCETLGGWLDALQHHSHNRAARDTVRPALVVRLHE